MLQSSLILPYFLESCRAACSTSLLKTKQHKQLFDLWWNCVSQLKSTHSVTLFMMDAMTLLAAITCHIGRIWSFLSTTELFEKLSITWWYMVGVLHMRVPFPTVICHPSTKSTNQSVTHSVNQWDHESVCQQLCKSIIDQILDVHHI